MNSRFTFITLLLLTAGTAASQVPASVSVQISVPPSMRYKPFDVPRFLIVPPNFSVSVVTRISGIRFLAMAGNGDIFVSQPDQGRILVVRPNVNADPSVFTFASGLRRPHDIKFATINGVRWVYVAESNEINRYRYTMGDTAAHDRQIIITGLPDSSSPELGGFYGHELKNIAIGQDGKLYVSVASVSNASISDVVADPVRGAIYQYNADGTGRRLFARGLRNAEGLAFLPGTNTLWATVNQRDNVPYPFRHDFDGNGSIDFGRVLQAYVDNHPPDLFTKVVDGANYGWPYANPNPDSASQLTNMPFDPDYDNNRDWTQVPESTFTRASKGIPAHSAPLGFSFLQASTVPLPYRNSAVVALHGSWNRSVKSGYKVVLFPFDSAGNAGVQMDLARNWFNRFGEVWGRPVDVVPDRAGDILISDDLSGTIYRLKWTGGGTVVTTIKSLQSPIDLTVGSSPAITGADSGPRP